MTGSKKLMDGLDEAAKQLLARHFPENAQSSNLIDPELQIKAFTACVNWYGPRTKLGPKDEDTNNEFTRLRDRLHGSGRRASKRDTRPGETETGAPNGHDHTAAASE
jgi:hypothetical protein